MLSKFLVTDSKPLKTSSPVFLLKTLQHNSTFIFLLSPPHCPPTQYRGSLFLFKMSQYKAFLIALGAIPCILVNHLCKEGIISHFLRNGTNHIFCPSKRNKNFHGNKGICFYNYNWAYKILTLHPYAAYGILL